jgi:ATP-dependent protease ClpP protease subunit
MLQIRSILEIHTRVVELLQAPYNFVKTHKSLRVKTNRGRKKWMKRTPAMAEGLTDHIWSLRELLTFKVPILR